MQSWSYYSRIVTSCEEDVKVAGIELDKVSADVMIGENMNLNVIFDPMDATNKNVTWESSNPGVATATDGVVTGVALGTATIKAVIAGKQLNRGNL